MLSGQCLKRDSVYFLTKASNIWNNEVNKVKMKDIENSKSDYQKQCVSICKNVFLSEAICFYPNFYSILYYNSEI